MMVVYIHDKAFLFNKVLFEVVYFPVCFLQIFKKVSLKNQNRVHMYGTEDCHEN